MQTKRYGAWSSSTDPAEISLTVETVVKILGIILGGIGTIKGVNLMIPPSTAQAIVDIATAGIAGGLTVYHSGQLLWGLFKKGLNKFYPPQVPPIVPQV